jgi:uncharacterized repeat protein (TIGR01451 family)
MRRISSFLLFLLLFTTVLLLSGCYSCKTYHKWKGTGPVPPELMDDFMWSEDCRAWTAAHKPAKKHAPAKPKPAKPGECGPYTTVKDYPVQNVVRLEKNVPREVHLNVPFFYNLKVTNLTDVTVTDVIVTDILSEYFNFETANPRAENTGNKLVWHFDSLDPKESIDIKVVGTAIKTGCLENCATVTYIIPICTYTNVVEARLDLTKTAPAEVLVCDPIPVQFVVTNSGTGTAQNVKIIDQLPQGLRTADGENKVVFDAGNLEPGQFRQFDTQLHASDAGKYVNRAVAISSLGTKAEATAITIARKPILKISKTGRTRQYLDRALTYDITVANTGDGVAKDTIVEDIIPDGVTRVSISSGGKIIGSAVTWKMGDLAPNSAKRVSVTYTPMKIGEYTNTANTSAYCADTKSASITTSVVGIPAVLLEVVDIEDPVEVGNTTTYVVTATNQGSMPGTDIAITGTWEDTQQYVSSSGATAGSVIGNTVVFAPLQSLPPKARATWKIVVRALEPGDVRFKVTMHTGEFERPVEETENTNLYE